VDEQNGRGDLVRVHEGRHLHVRLGGLPNGALLRLKVGNRKALIRGE
jgi:hypothetical protein